MNIIEYGFKKVILKISEFLPDRLYVPLFFRMKMGYWMDFKNPKTFNEKLQWLKLYDRNPAYTDMVDKYAVKAIVARKIGEQYIIPTLGVWTSPEEIDWDNLPERFVLKTTMGGGNNGVIICKNKKELDKSNAIKRLKRSLSQDLYEKNREWPYKNIPKRIIAEEYMEDTSTHELRDYKFFAFDGKVKALFVATERGSGDVKFDYFDDSFNHLDLIQQHPMSGRTIQKPQSFDEMIHVAEVLSKGIPEVRVDLYEVNGKVYFGELTFYHHGGVVPFHPKSWDYEFGKWIKLPIKNN